VPAVVGDDRHHHLQPLAARAVGGFGVGDDFAVFRPDLHLLHVRLVGARLGRALQGAAVHAGQWGLCHRGHLKRHGLGIGAHQFGEIAQVLPRQDGNGRQRRRGGRHQRQQDQLLGEGEARKPTEEAEVPVH